MVANAWLLAAVISTQGALLDRELTAFFAEDTAAARSKSVRAIAEMDVSFEEIFARLKTGRSYPDGVETGLVEESHKGTNGLEHRYAFVVPEDYDPSKSYRVCFYLHGGVNRREAWEKGGAWWRRFDRFQGLEQISVFPASWQATLWWQSSQVESLRAILTRLKRDYNVDESRVFLYGVSDGGTAVYYFAVKAPTSWAALFPFIGHPGVLENPAVGVEGRVFFSNLVNKPLLIVNGETDRLYPVRRVSPYVEEFERLGVDIEFIAQPGGHNTRWWNGERGRIEAFMKAHARVSYPDRVSWQTDDTDRYARVHWLVIDELAPSAGSGRVDLTRTENRVEVTTRRVRRYRLLFSPEQFDLGEPVTVTTNGETSFSGKLDPDKETLLRWAAEDDDRSMLFGAELSVEVP